MVADVPDEFVDPEGDGEAQDPEFGLETTTSRLRRLWAPWMCRRGEGSFADPLFFGERIGGVPAPAVEAYRALEAALRATGYVARSRWSYNCRTIAGTDQPSLHSAGIAVDIDPAENPYSSGDPYAGKLTRRHVAAVLAIENGAGRAVWSWGGNWRKPDRMHFQLDQGPDEVDVDWSTVTGATRITAAGAPARERAVQDAAEGEIVLRRGSEGKAVVFFQERLKAWNEAALPRWGADGEFGDETVDWVRRFQEHYGLDVTGDIDGVTAAVLAGMPGG